MNSELNSLYGKTDIVVQVTVLQLVKKFTIFRGTQRVITMFTRVCQWSLILQNTKPDHTHPTPLSIFYYKRCSTRFSQVQRPVTCWNFGDRISQSLSKTKSCRSTLCQQSMTDYSIYIHSHPPYLEVIFSSQNLRVRHDMVLR